MIAPTPWLWAVAVGLAFLLGSIPFSLLIGLVKGVDIRTVGSKNVGATNLGRALGGRYFALGFVCDMLKGLAPVLAVGMLFGLIGASDMTPAHAWAWLGVVAAAVLGHMFSPWVGFKGGKGVATGLGALLGVYPMLTVPALGGAVVFGVVFALWRYVSLASVCAAASLPAFTFLFVGLAQRTRAARALAGTDPAQIDPASAAAIRAQAEGTVHGLPFLVLTLALAVLVIWKHRGNLARLAAGTELRAGRAKPG
jgi:glycerol-3-phosphate acyltransferase PlsY